MSYPLPFTWPFFILFWAVYIWVFIPEIKIVARAAYQPKIPDEDQGSLSVVAIGFSISMFLAFFLPFLFPTAKLPGEALVWFSLGMVIIVSGSLLRRHCFKVLGNFFTGEVNIQNDHRVINQGAYRWVRHPSYSGALLIVLGIALAVGSWLSIIVALGVALPIYAYRARIEEQALLSSLGPNYAEFMATRKRFIPLFY